MFGGGSVQEGVEWGLAKSRERRRIATAIRRTGTLDFLQSAGNGLELLLSLLLECQRECSCWCPRAVWKREPCNRDIWPAIQVPSQPPILYTFVSVCRQAWALIDWSYLANFIVARVYLTASYQCHFLVAQERIDF